METVLQSPVILITNGVRGVGAATARLAAARRSDVAISFVSNEPATLAVSDYKRDTLSGLPLCIRRSLSLRLVRYV